MNAGVDRVFRQRTGMENTVQQSPVEPGHFVDHGLAAIGRLQAANQSIMDAHSRCHPRCHEPDVTGIDQPALKPFGFQQPVDALQ